MMDTLLRALYENVRQGHSVFRLFEYADREHLDASVVGRAFEELAGAGLARDVGSNGMMTITPLGIVEAERRLVAPDIVALEEGLRQRLLETLQRVREEDGPRAIVVPAFLMQQAALTGPEYDRSVDVLADRGLVRVDVGGCLQITSVGTVLVRRWEAQRDLLARFQQLKALDGVTPQQRGHALEDLLDEIAQAEEWESQKRVRSQGQEHDVIIHQGFHYFLVSAKWEKEPIEPEVLELLESRCRSRATVNGGLLISLSGFTDNCVEEARLKIAQAHILLFGPEDVASIFTGAATLTGFVDAKLEEAMHHRRILVDGRAC